MTTEGRVMSEPTLTDTEREEVEVGAALFGWATTEEAMTGMVHAVERIVAARVAEAVDRERAAWATKIETLLVPTYSSASDEAWQVNGHVEAVSADTLRALLAADTEEIHPSVQWVADAIAAAVSADDIEGNR